MTTKWIRSMGLVAMVLQAVGCATSHADPNFGKALAEARTRQTQNPGAGESVVQADGMGPGTAEDVLSNYHRNQDSAVQEQRQRAFRQNVLVNTSPNN